MSFAHRFSLGINDGEEDEVRAVALDVHRDFCEVAILAEGRLRSGGRIATRPDALELFAQSLDPRDRVALEVTGNAWAIAWDCAASSWFSSGQVMQLCSLATSGTSSGAASAAAHHAPNMCAWTRSASARRGASHSAKASDGYHCRPAPWVKASTANPCSRAMARPRGAGVARAEVGTHAVSAQPGAQAQRAARFHDPDDADDEHGRYVLAPAIAMLPVRRAKRRPVSAAQRARTRRSPARAASSRITAAPATRPARKVGNAG